MNMNLIDARVPRLVDFDVLECGGAAGGIVITDTFDHVIAWCADRASALRRIQAMCDPELIERLESPEASLPNEAYCALCRAAIAHRDVRASESMDDASGSSVSKHAHCHMALVKS